MATMMAERTLTDAGDRWVVRLEGAEISGCCFDFAVVFRITHNDRLWELRIGEPFVVTFGDDREELVVPEGDPAGLAPALRCLHQSILAMAAFKDGGLELRLSDDMSIRIPSSEAFEAWILAGPDGVHVVSAPGGELAIWDSATEEP